MLLQIINFNFTSSGGEKKIEKRSVTRTGKEIETEKRDAVALKEVKGGLVPGLRLPLVLIS